MVEIMGKKGFNKENIYKYELLLINRECHVQSPFIKSVYVMKLEGVKKLKQGLQTKFVE